MVRVQGLEKGTMGLDNQFHYRTSSVEGYLFGCRASPGGCHIPLDARNASQPANRLGGTFLEVGGVFDGKMPNYD